MFNNIYYRVPEGIAVPALCDLELLFPLVGTMKLCSVAGYLWKMNYGSSLQVVRLRH